jgi:hypothetical protein
MEQELVVFREAWEALRRRLAHQRGERKKQLQVGLTTLLGEMAEEIREGHGTSQLLVIAAAGEKVSVFTHKKPAEPVQCVKEKEASNG